MQSKYLVRVEVLWTNLAKEQNAGDLGNKDNDDDGFISVQRARAYTWGTNIKSKLIASHRPDAKAGL